MIVLTAIDNTSSFFTQQSFLMKIQMPSTVVLRKTPETSVLAVVNRGRSHSNEAYVPLANIKIEAAMPFVPLATISVVSSVGLVFHGISYEAVASSPIEAQHLKKIVFEFEAPATSESDMAPRTVK